MRVLINIWSIYNMHAKVIWSGGGGVISRIQWLNLQFSLFLKHIILPQLFCYTIKAYGGVNAQIHSFYPSCPCYAIKAYGGVNS